MLVNRRRLRELKKGDTITRIKLDREKAEIIEVSLSVVDIKENRTTDGTPGARIIICRGKRI